MKPRNLFPRGTLGNSKRPIHLLSYLSFPYYLPLPIVFCFILDIQGVPGHPLPAPLSGPSFTSPPSPRNTQSHIAHTAGTNNTLCIPRRPHTPLTSTGSDPPSAGNPHGAQKRRTFPKAEAWVKGPLHSGRLLAVVWVRKSNALKYSGERLRNRQQWSPGTNSRYRAASGSNKWVNVVQGKQYIQVAVALDLGGHGIGDSAFCSTGLRRCSRAFSLPKTLNMGSTHRISLATDWLGVVQPQHSTGVKTWPVYCGQALLRCDSGRRGEAAAVGLLGR